MIQRKLGGRSRVRSLMSCVAKAGALAFLSAASTSAAAQTVTIGSPSAVEYTYANYNIFDAAHGQARGFGEVFRTPGAAATHLDSWSFYLSSTDPALSVRLQIAEFHEAGNVLTLAAAPLFTSLAVTPPVSEHETRTSFDVGVTLDPSKLYVAFVNPVGFANDAAANFGSGRFWYNCVSIVPTCASSGYDDGYMVQVATSEGAGGFYRAMGDDPHISDSQGYDAQFEATFSQAVTATPEPASLLLLGTGLAAVASVGRRRRRI